MIITSENFDKLSKSIFKHQAFSTLTDSKMPRIRFGFNGDLNDEQKLSITTKQVANIFDTIFYRKEMWLRITIWDPKLNFPSLEIPDKYIKFNVNTARKRTTYVYLPNYEFPLISCIIRSIVGYELGDMVGKNIQCFFYDFGIPIVANLYDDRGMDVVTNNSDLKELISKNFKELILY